MLECSDGLVKELPLRPMAVADFYREFMAMLRSAGIEVSIWRMPVEIPDPIPFDEDRVHAAYDAERVETFWRILLSVDAVFHEFRSGFIGKVSPVHFFWGSFDLAVTRFSGRTAPAAAGRRHYHARSVLARGEQRGILAGQRHMSGPAFYSYAAPEPQGFKEARVRPDAARYDKGSASFCSTTTMCGQRSRRARRCWHFAKAHTMPRPSWANGIAACWNENRAYFKNSRRATVRGQNPFFCSLWYATTTGWVPRSCPVTRRI